MELRYMNYAYEKNYTVQPGTHLLRDDQSYYEATSSNVFLGTDRVYGDIFTVNRREPKWFVEDGKVYFQSDEAKLTFELDYDHRLDLMQQILGNAMVRMVLRKILDNIDMDYRITPSDNTVSFTGKDISFTLVSKIETIVNHLLLSNLTVKNNDGRFYVRGYGSVTAEGPALERTGECAILRIAEISRNTDTITLHILTGRRAFDDYFKKSKLIENLTQYLQVSEDQIGRKVKDLILDRNYEATLQKNPPPLSFENGTPSPTDLNRSQDSDEPDASTVEPDAIKNDDPSNLSSDAALTHHPYEMTESLNQAQAKEAAIEPPTSADKAIEALRKVKTEIDGINYIYKVVREFKVEEAIAAARLLIKESKTAVILGFPLKEQSEFYVARSYDINVNLKDVADKMDASIFQKKTGNMYEIEGTLPTIHLANVLEAFLLTIRHHTMAE
ncbi:hypothetical protein O6R05_04100 [Peptoniphilus equinus]|uniref:Uncharacterized protein n=1 Tax=Peptoniphilus equinus TaxID=3016343 RepID=A0ABY7QWD1_9FIRM|nr:hypothetical protein [Peptoniphilus equinus]WBW50741.1 hypothetical protein O6R05_04100 [Peptoniphilus equinus]